MTISRWLGVGAMVLGGGACASGGAAGHEPQEFTIEVAFESADGTRVVAPRVTCAKGANANVSAVRPFTYIQDYEVEVGQDRFIADPIVARIDEGVWLDFRVDRSADGRIDVWYALRRTSVKQPVDTFTTTLGAFTEPVTIQIPQIHKSSSDGTWSLDAGVETCVARLTNEDGSDPLTVFARVVAAPAGALGLRPDEDINLDPQ